MLALNCTIKGDKVLIEGLGQFAQEMPGTIRRGLRKVVRGIHPLAMAFLNGAGGAGRKAQIVGPSRGFTKKSGETVNFKQQFAGAGAYPVPVRTANLKRLLDFVDPGQTITSGGMTFTAGDMEVVIFDSAEYAYPIHHGTGSSRKFGPRPFLTDALNKFNAGNGIAAVLENEISETLKKKGLK